MGIISQRKVLLVVARRTLKNCVHHHNDYLLERRSRFSNFTAEFYKILILLLYGGRTEYAN